MSPPNPQRKSGPLFATRTEKMLNVADRNSGDLVRTPNGDVVVIRNIVSRQRIEGPSREHAAKLNRPPFALRFEPAPQHYS
jgi:hypothetical protein